MSGGFVRYVEFFEEWSSWRSVQLFRGCVLLTKQKNTGPCDNDQTYHLSLKLYASFC